jgi:DNA-directed RNA polymerase
LATVFSNSDAGIKIRQWRIKYYKSTGRSSTKILATQKASLAPTEEVALEYKRQRLLNSEDPEEIKQGEEMVTPTSIWLEHQDPKAITSYRLNLIGETKKEKTSKFDEMRDKVLDREADLIAKDKERADTSEPSSDVEAESVEATEPEAKATSPKDNEKGSLPVWIPLTFPPPPKKGGWDISRLRESKYFFS